MRAHKGVTMIELMVVVAIIGILAAIAYPSYMSHVAKARRSAAESFMMTVANKQEQYMLDARQYASDPNALTTLSLSTPTDVSSYYTISVSADNTTTPPSFTVTAQPMSTQQGNDNNCSNLTLDQTGSKGISGSGTVSNCW